MATSQEGGANPPVMAAWPLILFASVTPLVTTAQSLFAQEPPQEQIAEGLLVRALQAAYDTLGIDQRYGVPLLATPESRVEDLPIPASSSIGERVARRLGFQSVTPDPDRTHCEPTSLGVGSVCEVLDADVYFLPGISEFSGSAAKVYVGYFKNHLDKPGGVHRILTLDLRRQGEDWEVTHTSHIFIH